MRRSDRRAFLRVASAASVSCLLAANAAKANVTVQVDDIEELYQAIDAAAPGPVRIVLASTGSPYVLTVLDPNGAPRTNGGRLDLKAGMELQGKPGNPTAVVIDVHNLPAGAAAVRVGRGSNVIEWLTVEKAINATAAISTDLVTAGVSPTVRISNVIVQKSTRGIDIRNLGAADRVVNVRLEHNVLRDNTNLLGQGFRFLNTGGSNRAEIHAVLVDNEITGNNSGCQIANLGIFDGVITIDSRGDRFESNQVACVIFGGNGNDTASADDNSVVFEARSSRFIDNAGAVMGDTGALVVVGGLDLGTLPAPAASSNRVRIELSDVVFAGNDNGDINAWGARTTAATPAGTHNHVEVILHDTEAVVNPVDSVPTEPAGTNTVEAP